MEGWTPEIERIVKKMRLVTEDEEVQNGLYLPKMWDLIKEGKRCHQIDGGYGEFGREKTNPIPVNGSLGEVTYISRLVKRGLLKDNRVLFHRLGSQGTLDVYETVTADGKRWDLMWFDMYHPNRSRKAVQGYRIKKVVLWTGWNMRCRDFPRDLEMIMAQADKKMGLPTLAAGIRKSIRDVRWKKPAAHAKQVEKVLGQLTATTLA